DDTVATPAHRMGRHEELQTAHTARSLQARAGSPTQTPLVRRKAAIQPAEPPRKSNTFLTIFLALILVGVIIYGYRKIKPVFDDAQQQNQIQRTAPVDKGAAKNPDDPGAATSGEKTSDASDTATANENSQPSESITAQPAKKTNPLPVKSAASSSMAAGGFSPTAAEYKGRIEEAASEKGIGGKLKIHGTGNTLTLSGKLRPSEHGDLLKFLKGAPAGVQVVDDIQYDDTPVSGGASEPGSHPIPPPGRGAIHVITNVVGATAVVTGAYNYTSRCETPCSFSNLDPASYNLEVKKTGFQPTQTALQIRAGQTLDQKINLEQTALGLYIVTHPAGADVFINGDKQSGQTP